MCSSITAIAHRLHEYRKQLNKNQEEMCRTLDISQSQYDKLENAQNIISFNSLKAFHKNGGDVHYLITGEKYQPGILDRYLAKCHTSLEVSRFLKLMIWVTEQGMINLHIEHSEPVHHMWKYVSLAENEYSSQNIWLNIRKAENLSQIQMADILDIDVKRYRRFEKMSSLPDAAVLYTLHEKLSYSPLLFLENELYYPDIINRIWKTFPEALSENLTDMLDMGMNLIK